MVSGQSQSQEEDRSSRMKEFRFYPKYTGHSSKGFEVEEPQDQIFVLDRTLGSSVDNDLEGVRVETGVPGEDKLSSVRDPEVTFKVVSAAGQM